MEPGTVLPHRMLRKSNVAGLKKRALLKEAIDTQAFALVLTLNDAKCPNACQRRFIYHPLLINTEHHKVLYFSTVHSGLENYLESHLKGPLLKKIYTLPYF